MGNPACTLRTGRLAAAAAFGLLAAGVAAAQPTWLTVLGDPADPAVNTVEVDPVDHDQDERSLRVRVNRSAPRTSWDGVPYRSYEAVVLFDCTRKSARYQTITFFAQPLWRGDALRSVDYSTGPARMMEFRDVHPNPLQRIVHAACATLVKR